VLYTNVRTKSRNPVTQHCTPISEQSPETQWLTVVHQCQNEVQKTSDSALYTNFRTKSRNPVTQRCTPMSEESPEASDSLLYTNVRTKSRNPVTHWCTPMSEQGLETPWLTVVHQCQNKVQNPAILSVVHLYNLLDNTQFAQYFHFPFSSITGLFFSINTVLHDRMTRKWWIR
jgi:hypothetical protein